MYQTSEQFGNLIQQDSRTFYALLYFDGNTITDGISEIAIQVRMQREMTSQLVLVLVHVQSAFPIRS